MWSSTTDSISKTFYSEPDAAEYNKDSKLHHNLILGTLTMNEYEWVRYCNGLLKPYENNWWDHLANDNINHLQGASTLRLKKLDDNDSLVKEPISTHAKRATWTHDTKNKKQISGQLSNTITRHLSANRQRSYCSFFIWYESPFDGILDGWKNKSISFWWKAWTTHQSQAFPVSKIHKIPSPKRLRGCVYWGYWSNSKRLTGRCLHL